MIWEKLKIIFFTRACESFLLDEDKVISEELSNIQGFDSIFFFFAQMKKVSKIKKANEKGKENSLVEGMNRIFENL